MKLPPHQYLERHNIPYQRLTFPPMTEKGAASVVNLTTKSKPVFPDSEAIMST
jgi:hypothetical protein